MLINGNAKDVLATLEPESVQMCVTSPPYWGLRDYGVDGQLGLEKTPEAYVDALVDVFREVRRALRNDGTLWLNLGDSYAASGTKKTGRNDEGSQDIARRFEKFGTGRVKALTGGNNTRTLQVKSGLKPKDLVGIPWMVAFALRADGWYLRSDIIWSKPNPMPESVTDRPTKAHEYIFLLSKSAKYYYDQDTVREPLHPDTLSSNGIDAQGKGYQSGYRTATPNVYGVDRFTGNMAEGARRSMNPAGRNRRTVWNVATQPYKEAHFATFPEKLIEPCILAGAPIGGMVLDPFAGSGTTGVVALKNGRKFLGVELNPAYIEMAERRMAQVAPLFEAVA